MAFSVDYSKNIWSDGGRDAEVVDASKPIYMVKELRFVWSRRINDRMSFQSCKILGQLSRFTNLWSRGQIRVRVCSRGKTQYEW